MASRRIITDRGRCRFVGLLTVVLLCAAFDVARSAETRNVRTFVRLQGHRVASPGDTLAVDEMVLTARGVEHRFRVTDRRRFDLGQPATTPVRDRDRLTLQGDFDALARFAKARPDQQITVLGEQRVGSGDLFILTLDLCPP